VLYCDSSFLKLRNRKRCKPSIMLSTFLFSRRWIMALLRRVVCARKVSGTTRAISQSPLPSRGKIQHHHRLVNFERVKNYFAINFCRQSSHTSCHGRKVCTPMLS